MEMEKLNTEFIKQAREIEALQQELQQERELRETEERLIRMVLHEICTPLCVIQTAGYQVTTAYNRLSQEAIVRHLAVIKSQADYANDLITDISTIVSTHRRPTSRTAKKVNLKAIVEACVQETTLNNFPTNQIIVNSSGNFENFKTDAHILHSIISNVLLNAIKYSPNENLITLEIQGSEKDILIRISDQGIGIPPDEIKNIFIPFYRANNAMNFAGSGLGLAIVKNNVDMLGGIISVESEANKGTVFTICIPSNPVNDLTTMHTKLQ